MEESPEIRVETLEEARNTASGSKPAYVAALFKATLTRWPEARLRITGGAFLASEVEKKLVTLGVAAAKIDLLTVNASQVLGNLIPIVNPLSAIPYQNPLKPTLNSAGIAIVYRASPKRKVSIQFKPDSEEKPVEVVFEVSPSGTEVEVGAQVAVLKSYIKKFAGASAYDPAGSGRVRRIKIATKVSGLAQFDIEMQNKVATTLKAKIKEAIYLEIAKGVEIEFYGAGFAKYDTEQAKTKVGSEFGAGFTITWD